jgi:hypothetical protein
VRNNKSSCVSADNLNVLLDAALYKQVCGMGAKQRLALAEIYAKWSTQLVASATQMDSTLIKEIPALAIANN